MHVNGCSSIMVLLLTLGRETYIAGKMVQNLLKRKMFGGKILKYDVTNILKFDFENTLRLEGGEKESERIATFRNLFS